MRTLDRRVEDLEKVIGRDDDPGYIRQYTDGDTGETTRLHIRGGHVVRVEHLDAGGRGIPTSRLWGAV